ncbi:magnesium chelatase subunit ChlI family protein [Bacillus massilinigeriensis]|uniref:magnesium chelatase subunit ChlI family protein n=1 Tax=Bacillus massilionigeriensis TaxID=1805475 RepID=UPI0036F1DFF9
MVCLIPQRKNSNIPFEILTSISPLSSTLQRMITQVSAKQHWSNRVQIKIIRLARTISI